MWIKLKRNRIFIYVLAVTPPPHTHTGKVPEPVQGLGSGGDSSVVDEDERDYARNFNPLLEASLSKNRFYSDQAVPDSCVPDSDISNDDDDDDEYSVLS